MARQEDEGPIARNMTIGPSPLIRARTQRRYYMSQKGYRLAERLLSGERVQMGNRLGPLTQRIMDDLRSATYVEADDAGALYWQDDGDGADFSLEGSKMGPLRIPYDSLWVEYAFPAEIVVGTTHVRGGKRIPSRFRSSGSLLVRLSPQDALSGIAHGTDRVPDAETRDLLASAHEITFASTFYEERSGGAPIWIGGEFVAVDEQGSALGARQFAQTAGWTIPDAPGVGNFGDFVQELTRPAFIAVGLMNCRNVRLDDAPPLRVSKKAARKPPRFPRIDFKTIRVPAPGRSGGEGRPSVDSYQRLHTVRGHFKTYTADAPLLGRFTGTYWWGSQVRGSAKHGAIVKDYKVTPVDQEN